ncbi:hypothetical protein C474_14014 [Halogeometricum pallidum JCM 14848]|uniref:Uncharacterized protein n=2 Tax=Halogeometricum TaxID=60846 RepID=M0D2I0_HALPD|nr:hypothetical protein C474_14014 [Halogeometricum pallidum JCM 14848]
MNQFYSFCDELETQEKAAEFLISSLESYINHLEQFAVRDDEFRSYAVQGPVDIRSQNSVASPSDDRIQSLNDLEDYINACDRHIEYLQEYMNEDAAYKIHVESADDLLSGSVADMENAVLAGVSYLDYLEQYAGKNTHYNQYVEGFSVAGESYYSLVAAENELIKDLSA